MTPAERDAVIQAAIRKALEPIERDIAEIEKQQAAREARRRGLGLAVAALAKIADRVEALERRQANARALTNGHGGEGDWGGVL